MNTRKQIVEAMFILLNKYPIEKITVEMIAEQCEMSRASFYRYFQDKYQLMTMTYVFYTDKLTEKDVKERNWAAVLEKKLQFMLDNKRIFENLFKVEGQDSFSKFLYAHNLHRLREDYMKTKGAKDLTVYEICLMEFYISGMVHLEEQWFKKDMGPPPGEMALIILDSMPGRLRSVLMDT